MKDLSIVIPRYSETPKELLPLLSSIYNQVGVDFDKIEVIIVNDNPKSIIYDSDFMYPVKIIAHDENFGSGVARQTGIDHCTGQYLMFCDADDILHSVAVLGAFLQEINQPTSVDILTSPWLEELYSEDTGYRYLQHEDEATWMHGKVFRADFLRSNNIRFHDDLRVHEDSYFLGICFALTQNIRKLPVVTYVWKWREESITRQNDGAYTYNSFGVYVTAMAACFSALVRRGKTEVLPAKTLQFLLYCYFTLQSDAWADRPDDCAAVEGVLAVEVAPLLHHVGTLSKQELAAAQYAERGRVFANQIERELFANWAARVFATKK